ncbi:MAG: 1-acyl-sn-glycerol-3-phosphate acyltransferase [Proteobacteria bacterium]|nr:1-acyl-sn-glycerol-3-phosphate acyltransferase [Pseudomonadota bacterium]
MIKNIILKIGYLFKALFQHTLDHYACYLPDKPSLLSSALLGFFFSRISIDPKQSDQLKQLGQKGVVIYATKYKSHFAFLFCHTRYRLLGLPNANIGFAFNFYRWQPITRLIRIFFSKLIHFLRHFSFPDPFKRNYIEKELLNGKSAMISLVGKKAFYSRFVKAKTDPIAYLIGIQKKIDRPIYIVPQLMFFSSYPDHSTPTFIDILFGSQERPGKLRRFLTLLKNPGKTFVEISEPVSIKKFIESGSMKELDIGQQALMLRRHLVLLINRHRQTVTGPILKSREEIKENILTGESLQSYFQTYAEESHIPLKDVHKEADDILEEVAANYSMNWIKAYAAVVTWLKNNMFDDMIVDLKGLKRLKEASKNAPLILVPCHKSHLDYLMISYAFYKNNMPCPHIAAGKNLSFWPLGTIFRGGGAFFLRRTFRGAPFYSRIFSEYVKKILIEGFNMEFYIEGGRSRTGKVLSPKFGMLSILLNAFKENICQDLIFAPIFIGYDRVMEESSYLHEVEGGEKAAESIKQMIKARKFITKRYGKIYINFHEPLSYNNYCAQKGVNPKDLSKDEQTDLLRELGYKFIDSINKSSIVTPHAVVASAMLNCSKISFTYKKLQDYTQTYMDYLVSQNSNLADTLLIEPERALKLALMNYVQRKFIECSVKDESIITDETVFKIKKNKRPALDYYKNNSISFFIGAAYTSLSILDTEAFQFSTINLHKTFKFLQDLFSYEFAPDTVFAPEYIVRKNVKAFIDEAILIPHKSLPDTYNLTAQGLKKLHLFANFIKTYFESYTVAFLFFMKYPEEEFDYKGRLKKIQSIGSAMYKNNELETPESLSKINFSNAVSYCEEKGIKGPDDAEKIGFYLEKINRYRNLLAP